MKSFKVTTKYNGLEPYKVLDFASFVYDSSSVRQELEARCQILRGELPYNTAFGILLDADKDVIDLNLINLICTSAGVRELISLNSSIKDNVYTATVKVQTIYDDIIEVNI